MRHAYHHGTFGTAVCDLLTGGRPGWLTGRWPGPRDLPVPTDEGVSLLVATWRDLPDLDIVDADAHRHGHGWLPVVYDHPFVRVGPLVIPGAGPCLRCYHIRTYQHAGDSDAVLRTIRTAYDHDPDLGPAGHLSGHVAMAVALARLMLPLGPAGPSAGGGHWPAGTVARWHVVSQDLTVSQVVGVHGCPRCGVRRTPTDRAFVDLIPATPPLVASTAGSRA